MIDNYLVLIVQALTIDYRRRSPSDRWELPFLRSLQSMINSPASHINLNQVKEHQILQNIQYSLCSSYIKYASEKLAVREAHLITQTALLLQKIQTHSDKKDLTDLCTTEASLYNSNAENDQSSFNSNERKTTFKRKSKYSSERNTKTSVVEALQEIKEVCSQKTIALASQIFTDYQKLSQQQHIYDFRLEVLSRQTKFRKNREKCQQCQGKVQAFQKRLLQHEQKIITLNVANEKLKSKVEHLKNKLKESDSESQKKSILTNGSLTYKDLLTDKQKVVEDRCQELKLIQNAISSHLQSIAQLAGCKRCDIIHQIKSQIMDYRKHYEKQFQVLSKLLSKYKKNLQ